MKQLFRVLLLVTGFAVLSLHAPVTRAEELPLEKTAAGTTTLTYAGQTFRVNATAAVKLRFEMLTDITLKVTLVSDDGQSPGKVSLYWVDFQKYIYLGTIPLSPPWEGTLNTEGGFVDR
ncbi:MAG TPA: hypothetical protein VJS69_03335 [Candidatus Krumholzibacteria bacterium]|nr:hypothetical protein [Candidatus Krumholzibacteria bacterium]